MTLAAEIKKFQEGMAGQIPDDVLSTFSRTTEELINSGIAEKALHSGDSIPHFSLPDAFGKQVRSEDLLKTSPLVINFYRGSW